MVVIETYSLLLARTRERRAKAIEFLINEAIAFDRHFHEYGRFTIL